MIKALLLRLSRSADKLIETALYYFKYFIVKFVVKYFGAPRLLIYGMETNAMILRAAGASIGTHNVRLLSPITIHRANLDRNYSNLTIENNCVLNGNNYIDISSPVTIKNGASLGPGVIIMSHNFYNGNKFLEDRLSHTCGYKGVVVQEGAGIKAGAIIVMGVTVGANSVIAGQAIVNRDIPAGVFAAGIPAKSTKALV